MPLSAPASRKTPMEKPPLTEQSSKTEKDKTPARYSPQHRNCRRHQSRKADLGGMVNHLDDLYIPSHHGCGCTPVPGGVGCSVTARPFEPKTGMLLVVIIAIDKGAVRAAHTSSSPGTLSQSSFHDDHRVSDTPSYSHQFRRDTGGRSGNTPARYFQTKAITHR